MASFNAKKSEIDLLLAISVFFVAIFGLVMISSVSIYESFNLTKTKVAKELLENPSNAFYFWKHLIRLIIALAIGFVAVFIPYQFWKKFTAFFFVIISLFVWATLSNFGTDLGTISTNWIRLPVIGVLQPSEFMKIAIIFYLASWFSKKNQNIKSFENGFLPFSVITGLAIFPIILQPDYGTALIISLTSTMIYFAAGARISHILLQGLLFILGALLIMNISPYTKKRFETFFKKYTETEIAALDKNLQEKVKNQNWQRDNSLIAVGSGGLFGRGFGKGVQKNGYLPEAQSDMIFAATAEEMGFIRMLFLIAIYFIIFSRGISIAINAPDRFSTLVSVGIVSNIAIQTFINIAMCIDLFPITGITLPLISYGGSSLILTLFELAVLLNISYFVKRGTSKSYTHRK